MTTTPELPASRRAVADTLREIEDAIRAGNGRPPMTQVWAVLCERGVVRAVTDDPLLTVSEGWSLVPLHRSGDIA